ncbi:MAG: hypothetical protein ACRERU_16830 [Methylococcales bacterium]
MIELTDLTGLFSTTLFLTTFGSTIFPWKRFSGPARCLILVALTCLILVPFAGMSAAGYVRSYIGDLSITSLVILFLTLIGRAFALIPVNPKKIELFCVPFLPLALVFYPLAMGLGKYDPYSLGYGSLSLLGFVFLVTLLASATDQWFIALSLSLSVMCYALGWYESNNLWDYLLDPLLATYALGICVRQNLFRPPP